MNHQPQQLIRGSATRQKATKILKREELSERILRGAMAEKEKDDTDKYLHKLEKKISGKLKKTDKNKKSLKRLLECLREERKKTKEEETSGSVITTETTNVKTIAIDLKEGKQRIQLINSLISKSGESTAKKKEARAKKKLEAAKRKDRVEEEEEERRGDVEEILSRPGSSRSKSSVEVAGGASRQEMDAKRLDSSESRIRSFESFARSSQGGKKGGEKTKKELPVMVKPGEGRGVSVEPFLEEKQGGFLDRVVPGKSKKKTTGRDEREQERREEGMYKDRDMMVEDGYEEQDYRDQEAFWPGSVHRGPARGRDISEDQRYRPRRDEYRGWEDDRSLRGRREEDWEARGRNSWGDEGSERRRPRPPPLSPRPPSSRSHHPSIHINPHHPSNRSYAPPHEESWGEGRRGGYERRREDYRDEGSRHSREWVGRNLGRREEEELGRRRERYWGYEDEEEEYEDEDKLSEDDEDFAATGCRRANDDL